MKKELVGRFALFKAILIEEDDTVFVTMGIETFG